MTYPFPQQPAPDPNRHVRTAGTIALWIWIVIALVPILFIGGCIALCAFGGFLGAITPSPSPTN